MRGPPGGPQSGYQPQQQYHPRMRGPPRGVPHGQPYAPRGAMPQPHAQPYYPHMQQMPPAYMMGSQPGMYLPPGPMQYYPVQSMNMGIPGGMPMPMAQQTPTHQPPAKRESKALKIVDPKTGKPIDLSAKKTESAPAAAPAPAPSDVKKTDKSDAPATKAATSKAPAPASPKKETKQPNGAPKSPQKKAAPAEKPATPKKEAPVKKETPVKKEPTPAPAAAAAPAPVKSEPTLAPAKKTETKPVPAAPAAPAPSSPTKSAKNGSAAAAVASPKVTKKEPAPASPTKAPKPEAVKTESPKKKSAASPKKQPVASPTKTTAKTESKTVVTATSSEKTVAATVAATTKTISVVAEKVNGKTTYSVEVLFRFRELFTELPAHVTGPDAKWPTMEVVNDGPARGGSRGGRGGAGGAGWEREKQGGGASLARQTSRGSSGGGGGNQWARSQDVPKRGRGERGGRGGGRGGRGQAQEPLFDGPVKPLERTDNRWIPVKATSGLEAVKKKVYSIMNKMTREKFDRLAAQLTEIEMESLEMLQGVITILFDKALGEPHFCDMYADLCVHLEQNWKVWSFLQIVQNDDDSTFYWTTMAESDTEVVGPFDSPSDALDAAKSDEFEPSPAPASMKLSEVRIQHQKFIKVWVAEPDASAKNAKPQYYWSGQLLEDLGDDQALNGPFESYEHANRTAIKACSFKRILLNACQEEFEKDNIYEELEETFKQNKLDGKVTPDMQAEYEEKRMIMKSRMLGNIRFIGELFRKGMLQERIMHECIMKLMGVAVKDGSLTTSHPGNTPDEENLESLCKLLTTMGKDLDRKGGGQGPMQSYFQYLEKVLLKDKRLCSRINFMIKDVIDLRANRWEPRRKELKTKTLDEIRKEAERELQKPPASAPSGGDRGGRNDSFRMDNRRSNSSRDNNSSFGSQGRPTMAQVYSSQSMSSRSSSKMTLPDRSARNNIQRDDSIKTGPQGRPASFGGARRGGAATGGAPASFSSRSRNSSVGAATDSTARTTAAPAKKPEARVTPLSDDAKEKIAKRAKSIAEEYVSIVDISEADACLSELVKEFSGHAEVALVFAKEILQLASDAKNDVRTAMFDLLEKLVLEKKSLAADAMRYGIEKMVELAVDLWCDVPKLHEHVADVLVRFMVESSATGVTFDWFVCGCGKKLDADVFDEVVQGGFLAAASGHALKLLAGRSVEKAKAEVRATYTTLPSLFPSHDRSAASIEKWIAKCGLSDVLPLAPAFELVAFANSAASFDDVVQWIEAHIPLDLRTDAVFATHACLFLLERYAKGELPSQERCMLLTGFCGDVETQVRLVSGILQTRSDAGAYCSYVMML